MLTELAFLQAEYPVASALVVFIYGALIGSFLNVVIYRTPVMMERMFREESIEFLIETADEPTRKVLDSLRSEDIGKFNLVVPRSRCPNCGRQIKAWENIPIISYFTLGGKCPGCDYKISLRYPAIEFLTAALTVVVFLRLGFTLPGFAAMLLTWALVAVSFIDFDTQFIPDDITLPFLWLGLLLNLFGFYTDIVSALLGAVAGYMILWSVYQVFKLVTGKEGMGFGDFKLLAMFGAWLGWQSLPMIILFSSLAGAVIGGALIALGRGRDQPMPFGPYLAIAGWIAMLWGPELMNMYLGMMTV